MGFVIAFFAIPVVIGIMIAIFQGMAESETKKEHEVAVSRISNFTPAVQHMGAGGSAGIAIDPSRNKFALLRPNQPASIFHFHDLIGVEVFRNENSVTKTNRGSQVAGAAVGGLLLGPAGLLLGGLTGTKRNEVKINKLSMKVYTNDLVSPVTEIAFFDAMGTAGFEPNSPLLSFYLNNLDEWHGRLKTILAMQDSIPAKPEDFANQSTQKPSTLDTLDGYKVKTID